MNGLIDFHSHILPCADHGSDGVDMSLHQLKLMQEADVKTVIATPHFYPDKINVEPFLKMRSECLERLKKRMETGMPDIIMGAEVLICPMMQNMPGLEKLCIENTDYLLLEMPFYRWSDVLFETVEKIIGIGIKPIMAHIDRYNEHDVERLMRLNVGAQINAEAVNGFLGRKKIMKWIECGKVVAIGSDLHGDEDYKYFTRACKKLGERTNRIMSVSERILENDKSVF